MPFEFIKKEIPEIILIKPRVFEDERGFFMETYKKSEFVKNGIKENFIQDNHSKSTKGVLRGLHFQTNPKAQAKLVRCLKGKILDVGVDLRKGSPTYGKHVAEILTEENKHMLYIPVGFAHGFLTLSDEAEIHYKTTQEYSPENDSGIIWNDKTINIDWKNKNPSLSDKDKILKTLEEAKNNFIWKKN
ncbi:MAG: dTDP-4-dehydrorhamnose 3,5-epimerase [Nanoarchaeota archaeon]|nr:dTDP-4-dehydrorhamnose 3,5-epimerase [Nanoarchaeota archaeon]